MTLNTKLENFKTSIKFWLLSFKSDKKSSEYGKIESEMKLINILEGILEKPQEKLNSRKLSNFENSKRRLRTEWVRNLRVEIFLGNDAEGKNLNGGLFSG